MAIKANDQHALDELVAEHKGSWGGCDEDYFALIYLRKRFKANVEDVKHQVAFGGKDYGIDAYYIDHAAHNLYLYQFKWTENHQQFKISLDRLTKDGIDRIFGNPLQDTEQNPVLTYLKKEMNEARDHIARVYIQFVFKGDVDACDASEGLVHRKEDLHNKAEVLVNTYFGRAIELQVHFVSDKPGKPQPSPTQAYQITLDKPIRTVHDATSMYVGFLPLHELHRMYVALREQLFDRNIRGMLPRDNIPNKRIKEALERIVLKATDEPSVFPFCHNGVTIVAEKVHSLDSKMMLYVPRVLNGAQTVSSVDRFLDEHSDNPLLKQNRDRFEAIAIVAKIIEADPASDFITQVTIANNRQNPVLAWNLRAMDRRQVDLADKFREELGIFYSRQEGVFQNLSDEEKKQLGITDDRDMRIRPLAQTFLAVQGDVYNMGHLPDVFESQQLYEKAFKYAYNNADAKSIVMGYKVGLMISRIIGRLKEIVPAKYYESCPKARNIVWALLIQALLNEKKCTQCRELYGGSMQLEFAFGDLLKQLAAIRVWPLLKDVINSPSYKDKIEQNKYDFLRTADAFKKAMNLAADKFGWQKRTFV